MINSDTHALHITHDLDILKSKIDFYKSSKKYFPRHLHSRRLFWSPFFLCPASGKVFNAISDTDVICPCDKRLRRREKDILTLQVPVLAFQTMTHLIGLLCRRKNVSPSLNFKIIFVKVQVLI